MSRRKKSRDEEISDAYDRFKTYVEHTVSDGDNPNLTVADFGELNEPSKDGILRIPLRNGITIGDRHMRLVRDLKRGAELKITEAVEGGLIFSAYIPVRVSKKKRHHRYDDDGDSFEELHPSKPPPTTQLMAWLMLLPCIAMIAVWKTSWSDWSYLWQ